MEILIRKIQQIEKEDRRIIFTLFLLGVFTGIFAGTMELVANVVFLERYGAGRVPLAFMISGGVGILIASIYSYFSKQLEVRTFGILNTVAVTGLSAALLSGRYIMEPEHFDYVMFVAMGPMILIALLGFWINIRGFLSAEKVKQLSGIIELGVIGGMVFAFLLTIMLVMTGVGIYSLLFLGTGSLFLAAGCHMVALSAAGKRPSCPVRKVRSTGPIALISHRYTALMAAFALLGVSVAVVVHYSFLWVTEEQFSGIQGYTIFIGVLFALMLTLGFLIKRLVFDRLKNRYGIRVTLLSAPVIVLVLTAATAIAGERYGFAGEARLFTSFFLHVVLTRFLFGFLKASLEVPSMNLIYQTLNPRERYNVQSGIDGMLNQAGVFSIGLFLACFVMFSFLDFIHVIYLLLIIAAAWFFVGLALYRNYHRILQVSLESDRIREFADQTLADSVKIDLEKSAFPQEMIQFNSFYFHFTPRETLLFHLGHSNAGVRRLIWDHLLNTSPGLPELTLSQLLVNEHDPTVKERIRRLARRKLKGWLGLQQAFIRERLDRFTEGRTENSNAVYDAFHSGEENEIYAALYHVAEHRDRNYLSEVISLLREKDPGIVSVAISTAGLIDAKGIGGQLVDYLKHPELYAAAWSALVKQGESVLGELEAAFQRPEAEIRLQKRVVSVAAAIGSSDSMQFLVDKMNYHHRDIFSTAVTGLYENGYQSTELTRAAIENAILRMVRTGAWNLAALTSVRISGGDRSLSLSLEHEIYEVNSLILMLLSMIYDRRSVRRIRMSLLDRQSEERGVAIELLDLLVKEPLKKIVISYFEDVSVRGKIDKLQALFQIDLFPCEVLLKKILNRDGMQLGDFIRICALQSMGNSDTYFDQQQILAQGFHPNPKIRETAAQILRKNDPERYHLVTERLDFADNSFPGHQDAAEWYVDTTMRLTAWRLFKNVGINSLFRLVSALKPLPGEISPETDQVVLARSLTIGDFTPLSTGIAIIAAYHPEILEQISYLGHAGKCEAYLIERKEFTELLFDNRSLLHAFCGVLNQTTGKLV